MSSPIRRSRRRGPSAIPISPQSEAGLAGAHLQAGFHRCAPADARRRRPSPTTATCDRRRQHRRRARAISHPARQPASDRQRRRRRHLLRRQGQGRQPRNIRRASAFPNFELDLFGRLRSLTDVQLNRYFATEAGRAGDAADAGRRYRQRLARPCSGFEPAADFGAGNRRPARRRAFGSRGSASKAESRRAPISTRRSRSSPPRRPTSRGSGPRSRRTSTRFSLLVGAPIAAVASRGFDRRGVRHHRAGLSGPRFLRPAAPARRDPGRVSTCAPPMRTSVPRARRCSRRSRSPGCSALRARALLKLFTGGAFGWSAGADATYTIFQAGAGHANVRLTQASSAPPRRNLPEARSSRPSAMSPTRSPGAAPSTTKSPPASASRPRPQTPIC